MADAQLLRIDELKFRLEIAEKKVLLEKLHTEVALHRCNELEKLLNAQRNGKKALQNHLVQFQRYELQMEKQYKAYEDEIAELEKKLKANRQIHPEVPSNADEHTESDDSDYNPDSDDQSFIVSDDDIDSEVVNPHVALKAAELPVPETDDGVDNEASNDSSSENESDSSESLNGDDVLLFYIKKLVHVKGGTEWKATFEDEKVPRTIICKKENNEYKLSFGGKKSHTEKMFLYGVLKQSDIDPFEEDITSKFTYTSFVSRLLKHVDSCDLTELFLYNQKMSWLNYETLVDGGNVKSLYFSNVSIVKENGTFASIKDIMENLPNIERFGCSVGRSESIQLTIETFIDLPNFEHLQEFCMYDIGLDSFDPDSFIDFMKDHQNTDIYLLFRYARISAIGKTQVDALIQRIESHPLSGRLVIDRK